MKLLSINKIRPFCSENRHNKIRMLVIFIMMFFFCSFANAQEIFEVKFTVGVTQYRGALAILNNGTGKMRVRYYKGETKMVEQTMRIEDTPYGIRLTGYNPVFPGTSVKYPTYNADNFFLSADENGNYKFVNIDDAGTVAHASIRKIEGRYSINDFLDDFNWELKN